MRRMKSSLGLGQRRLQIVAEFGVGDAEEGRMEGQVGPPFGRAAHRLEVVERALAHQLQHQVSTQVRRLQPVQVFENDPPDLVDPRCLLRERGRCGRPGQLLRGDR